MESSRSLLEDCVRELLATGVGVLMFTMERSLCTPVAHRPMQKAQAMFLRRGRNNPRFLVNLHVKTLYLVTATM